MIYNIFSVLILAILTALLVSVVLKIIRLSRQDRILYIKGYKKSKFVYVYLITIPLVMLGYLFNGVVWYQSIFLSIKSVVNFALLQFDFAPMQSLIAYSVIYEIAVYYSFILICLNTVLFAFSILGQFIFETVENLKFALNKGDKLYIFGFNESSRLIYNNCDLNRKVLIDNLSLDDKFSLYVKRINYLSVKSFDEEIQDVFIIATKSKCKINVLINTENDETNVILCEKFIELINGKYQNVSLFEKLGVLVYGNSNYESLYQEIEKNSKGIIRFINKYKLIAHDFIKKYPLSYFLKETQVDYKNATVNSDVEINFNIIGFGKTGIQLYLSSIENNQFITKIDGKIEPKNVNYYIYDQTDGKSSKLLNHTYFRYAFDFNFDNAFGYLPLPKIPSNQTFYKLNVNDNEFYKNIKERAEATKNSVNFVAVALANDLENIDIAKKLSDKMREWGVLNCYIFVKIRDSKNNYLVQYDQNIFVFGNEDKIVYDIDEVLNDQITQMAIKRNAVYDLEYLILNGDKNSITSEEYLKALNDSNYNWYALRLPLERESNYSAVLSIRGKLNLIGYDLVATDSDKTDYLDFIKDYSHNDKIEYLDKQGVLSKKIVAYSVNNLKPSLRQNYAILEHLRWNSFMFANGFIPSTIDEIVNGSTIKNGKIKHTNGKDYSVRKHGNLTTFDGLIKYANLISERDNISHEKADVIRYDYQLLDDVGWLIEGTPYKIVKK